MSRKLLTLVLIEENSQILLGMKKRGFGAGRWNGFGGKVEEDESLIEAAKRETVEECGVEIIKLAERGVLEFSFANKPEILEVHIFKAIKWLGGPQETEEMLPEWFPYAEIPYNEMWADDRYWLPLFLEGKKFKGHFLFDENDVILSHELLEVGTN